MTGVAANKQWMSEINQYKLYVQQYSDIVESPEESDQEMLDDILSTWKETLRTTHFCGYNDINSFYKRYRQYEKLTNAKCKICNVCGSRIRTHKKKLQDCIQYLYLLEVEEKEVRDYEAIV